MASPDVGGVAPVQDPSAEEDFIFNDNDDDSTIMSVLEGGQFRITLEALHSDGKSMRKESVRLTKDNLHEERNRDFGLELLAIISPLILHGCATKSTTQVALEASNDNLNTEGLTDYAITDKRYLRQAVTCLVTGELPEDVPCNREYINKVKADVSMFSNMMCLFIITEMIVRVFSKGPGVLQLVLGHMMTTMKVPTDFKDVMSRIRLAASRKKMEVVSEKEVIEKIKEGKKAGPGDLVGWFLDNIGFKHYGAVKRSGYTSAIVIHLLCVPASVLRKIGIYGASALSRIRKTWDEVKRGLSARDFLPNENDYDTHGVRWLSMWDLGLLAYPHAPTLEQARARLEGAEFYCDERTPDDIGMHCQDVIEAKGVEESWTTLKVDEAGDMGVAHAENMYEKNYITTEPPINANLAKKLVVVDLLNGSERVLNQVVSQEDEWEQIGYEQAPIGKDFGAFVNTDGAPAIQALKEMEAKPNEWPNIMWRAGGFHYLLKAHCGSGATFGDITFGWTVGLYRKTEKQKKWVLQPSDPNQTDAEVPEILRGYVMALIDECKERKAVAELCAEQMHDFFVELARQKKHVFALLMHMLWTSVIFMVRDSERDGDKGNHELFFTALRFLLPFFTVNNNTGYVELGVDWETWRRTASDADMKIFVEFIFTKLTVNGKSIFGDRFVEWTVEDHRKPMGRFFRPGHKKLLRKMSLTMTNALKVMNPMKGVKPDPGTPVESSVDNTKELRTVEFGYVFCKTYVAAHDSNFFGEGPLKDLKTGEDLPAGSTPDGENIISDNFLRLWSICEERTLAVVGEKCFGMPASKTTNRFSRPARFVSEEVESAEKIRQCTTTLDASDLLKKENEKVATIDFLKAEYDWLRTLVTKAEGFPSRFGNNKSEKAASLVTARAILNNKDPTALEARANDKIGAIPIHESDLDTKQFYKLTEKARALYRDKRPLRKATEVPAVAETQQSAQSACSDLTVAMKSQGIQSTQSSAGSSTRTASQSPPKKRSKEDLVSVHEEGDEMEAETMEI